MLSKLQVSHDKVSTDDLFDLILKRFDVEETDIKKNLTVYKDTGNLDMQFLTDLLIAFEEPAEFSPKKLLNYPIQLLVNYLKATHQYYINKRLPEIEQTIAHLENKCQGNNASLKVLKYFFSDYKHALLAHIASEESELYPYVTHLSFCFTEKRYESGIFQSQNTGLSLDNFLMDHDHEHENRLNEIVEFLSKKNDTLKDHLSFKILQTQFNTFKKDLQVHEILEEEVLIPKAKILEKELRFESSL